MATNGFIKLKPNFARQVYQSRMENNFQKIIINRAYVTL